MAAAAPKITHTTPVAEDVTTEASSTYDLTPRHLHAVPTRASGATFEEHTSPPTVVHVLDRGMVSGHGKYATDQDGATPQALSEISFNGIRALIDSPAKGVAKDEAQWCIPSLHRSRKGQETQGRFVALWLDVDEPEGRTIQQIAQIVAEVIGGCDFEIYASRSATEAKQKCRVLIPLSTEITPHQWLVSSELLRRKMSAAGVDTDPTTEKPGQVLYLPNSGDFYATAHQRDDELFQPLVDWAGDIANRKAELAQQAQTIAMSQEAAKQTRAALTAHGFKSAIEAFNAAYDVADILLQHGYKQRGNTFMHPNSHTGSYSATVKNGRVHSLSTTDPLYTNGAGGHDAFSAFEVLNHGGNRAAALKDAGDNLLKVGDETWNQVRRREHMQSKATVAALPTAGTTGVVDEDGVINSGLALPSIEQPRPLDQEAANELIKPDEEAKLSFEFVPIGEMLKSPQPVQYLIDELIEHPCLGLIFGPHSCGKSFVTLSIAACVATGTPWMSRPVTRGAVFYLAGEGHAGLSRRLMAWSVHSGVSLENAPLFVSIVPAQIMDEQSAADVGLAIKEMSQHYGVKPALIVVDTFARNMGNGDESSNKDVGVFISRLDRIRDQTGATVLIVHHSGHSQEAQDRGRGASSIGAAMDCIFQLAKDGDQVTVTPRKTKEDAVPKPMQLKLAHPVNLPSHWVDAKGRLMTSAVAIPDDSADVPTFKSEKLGPAVQLALDIYCRVACDSGNWHTEDDMVHVQLEDWRKVFYEKSTASTEDAKRSAFHKARKKLEECGILTVEDGVYTIEVSNRTLQMVRSVQLANEHNTTPKA